MPPENAPQFAVPLEMQQQLASARQFVQTQLGLDAACRPRVGIVLGSGLGRVGDDALANDRQTQSHNGDIRVPRRDTHRNIDSLHPPTGSSIDYVRIPHFPVTTVAGHTGRLICGTIHGVETLILQGRVHLYEGHSAAEIVFPIHLLLAFGIDRLILTNSAGGLDPGMTPGDLMLITDHINLTRDNPLQFRPRQTDRSARAPSVNGQVLCDSSDMRDVAGAGAVYSRRLQPLVRTLAKRHGLRLHEGVYAQVTGPTYETRAEVRMLQRLGANAVGMSTVPEAIVASRSGAEVIAISCITNAAAGLTDDKLSHDEVTATARSIEQPFSELVRDLVAASVSTP